MTTDKLRKFTPEEIKEMYADARDIATDLHAYQAEKLDALPPPSPEDDIFGHLEEVAGTPEEPEVDEGDETEEEQKLGTALSLLADEDAIQLGWEPFFGKRGGRGFRDSVTGKIVYGKRRPGRGWRHSPRVHGPHGTMEAGGAVMGLFDTRQSGRLASLPDWHRFSSWAHRQPNAPKLAEFCRQGWSSDLPALYAELGDTLQARTPEVEGTAGALMELLRERGEAKTLVCTSDWRNPIAEDELFGDLPERQKRAEHHHE
jgi:hypothetical protein